MFYGGSIASIDVFVYCCWIEGSLHSYDHHVFLTVLLNVTLKCVYLLCLSWAILVLSDGSNSSLSPVVHGYISLSINIYHK